MTAPTFAVGDTVRLHNTRGLFRIIDWHIVRGEVVLYGGANGRFGYRYVTVEKLRAARKGDAAPGVRKEKAS